MKVKVGVNGYGTIGKRISDAVSLQNDMEISGVTKTKPDFEAKLAIKKGYKLYAGIPDRLELFRESGLPVEGTIEDLVSESDVIADCSPNKVGADNKTNYYQKGGVKAIFQGGEKKDTADISFNALANYDDAKGKDYVRVVSCNTTGLTRVLYTIKQKFGLKKVRATMIRRVVDPKEDKKGLVNGIMPDPVAVPSHHGPDVQTVIDVNITTTAFKVPTTLMHVHSLNIETEESVNPDDVAAALREEPRIMLVSSKDGFSSTAKVIEYARELRMRSDLFENVIWEDSIGVADGELYLTQAIPQESIVIPENLDAIRAMFELTDKENSINTTNKTLDIF